MITAIVVAGLAQWSNFGEHFIPPVSDGRIEKGSHERKDIGDLWKLDWTRKHIYYPYRRHAALQTHFGV